MTMFSGGLEEGAPFFLRALRSRNYRLFFGGQGTSLIGTWLTRIAMSWMVYRMTGSPWMLGVVGFAGQIPSFFLSPLAGVWVDRWNRHRILIVTQILSMLQSFALAALALSGRMAVWHILVLSLYQGLVNAFDVPARQTFVVEMVDSRDDLPNAIALNSSMFNGARLIGPSIAGILIAWVGEGMCFLLDGFSYFAVIASLAAMRFQKRVETPRTSHVMTDLREGFRYAFGFGPIRNILGLLALVNLVGMPYIVLMPVFAKDILHGGSHTLGFLVAASGVGALAGAFFLAARKSVLGLGRVIVVASASFGIGLVCFSLSRATWLSLFLMLIVGFGMMVQAASCNTVVQTIVEDDKRGRIMSLYSMAVLGMLPFGNLLAGAVAARWGVVPTVIGGGICCMMGSVAFARELPAIKRLIRPIYVRKGILPEVASGLQMAARGGEGID